MENETAKAKQIKAEYISIFPERCQMCPVIGKYATMYAILLAADEMTPAIHRAVNRLTFSRTGNSCPTGVTGTGACGSTVDISPSE